MSHPLFGVTAFEADFDPYVLHEWPRVVQQLAQRLQAPRWRRSADAPAGAKPVTLLP